VKFDATSSSWIIEFKIMMKFDLVLLKILCNLMSIQGNGIILKGVFYDYHHDHDFGYDYHSMKKKQIDGVKTRKRFNDNDKGNIKTNSASVIYGIDQSYYDTQCERQFLSDMKHDDSYLENTMFDQNYYAKGYFFEENTIEEFLTRTQRNALYDPTIKTNHVNDFNHRYYPNGFHYFGKIPRNYEIREYIHRCYYGDQNIVCVIISDKNDNYVKSDHKINYISESKLRWFIT